jgi:hypothetical protein
MRTPEGIALLIKPILLVRAYVTDFDHPFPSFTRRVLYVSVSIDYNLANRRAWGAGGEAARTHSLRRYDPFRF